jgi:secondary thiamine-phosphate synthase enzyme
MHAFRLQTKRRCELLDISDEVQQIVAREAMSSGLCLVYSPHTTAGIFINENADPDVGRDILTTLERIFPHQGDYLHAEGNSDSHLKAMYTGTSQLVIVNEGRLSLGRWQGIFFAEFDGPRNRTVNVQLMPR